MDSILGQIRAQKRWGHWSEDDENDLQLFDFELQANRDPLLDGTKGCWNSQMLRAHFSTRMGMPF